MNDKPRHVEIREKLDRVRAGGFGAVSWPDMIDDIAWLLDELKRLRRAG